MARFGKLRRQPLTPGSERPMTRDSNIPLFLWIATAILVHLMWAGGADRIVSLLERRLALRHFVAGVDARAKSSAHPIEVALLEVPEAPEPQADPPEEPVDPAQPPDETLPEPKPEPPAEVPIEEEQDSRIQKLELIKPDEKKQKKQQKLDLLDPSDRRIAVAQHVEDKDQEDNPNAEFIAEHANRVEEQTQARITSTDQNDPDPTPGATHSGPTEFPGNSERTRVAQSEDSPGEADLAPDPVPPQASERRQQPQKVQPPKSQKPRQASRPAPKHRQPAPRPKPTELEPARQPDVVTARRGTFALPSRRRETSQRTARRRAEPKPRPSDMLGLGATGTTDRGVNLNLTTQSALAAVGRDVLASERKRDAQRRLSEHRGSWKSLGIERWRSAIENYVPSVKLGNTTSLNTARNPFANYLNRIHNRLHPIFADTFLASLDRLPNSHRLNQPDLKTFLEIVVRETDGQLVRMGVTRTSGVTAFDIGALESVQRASPFGTPPAVIVSPDRNVYLHWEFHRNPIYACSTYFARPYILKSKPKTAPPDVEPSPGPSLDPKERPPSDPRRGLWKGSAGGGARVARSTHWWLPVERAVF